MISKMISDLKIAGRCGTGTIKAIVLHAFSAPYDDLIAQHEICEPDLACPSPCTSYHYGFDAGTGNGAQFVEHADQSITFVNPVNLDPASIALVGEAPLTSANCTTINVALAVGKARAANRKCKCAIVPDTKQYKELVKMLASIVKSNPLFTVAMIIHAGNATAACPVVPEVGTCNKALACLDIVALRTAVTAELALVAPAPIATPGCQTLTLVGNLLTLSGGGCGPSTATLPAAGGLTTNTLSFVSATGLLTSTVNGVPATATITIPASHPAAVVTFTAGGGNTFNAATQTLNIEPNPPVTLVLDNQALSTPLGTLTITPSVPSGPEAQVDYAIDVNISGLVSSAPLNALTFGPDGKLFVAPVLLADMICPSLGTATFPVGGTNMAHPDAYIGESNSVYLSDPSRWITVTCGGVTYRIPAYRV